MANAVNQWIRINRLLQKYQIALIALSVSVVILATISFVLLNRDTLVVVLDDGKSIFLKGVRGENPISEADVKEFAEKFLELRYSWDSDNFEAKLQDLSPLMTAGLFNKLQKQILENQKQLQAAKISQKVVVNEVRLEEGAVLANLDQIISINGKGKLPSTLEISLEVVRGKPNQWNKIGLFVNGIIEHQGQEQ